MYRFPQQWREYCQLLFACCAHEVFDSWHQFTVTGLARGPGEAWYRQMQMGLQLRFCLVCPERVWAYLFIYKQKGMISVSGKEGVGFS